MHNGYKILIKLVEVSIFLLCCQAHSQQELNGADPRNVMRSFCAIDAAGKQLTEHGWNELSDMFYSTRSQFPGKYILIKDFWVARPELRGNETLVAVTYTEVGQLDSKGAYSVRLGFPSAPVKVIREYPLVLEDEKSEDKRKDVSGSRKKWRIREDKGLPHITLETAINYVKELHDTTSDAKTKKRLMLTIATLRRLAGGSNRK
jgi:hypothetical protein